MRGEHLFVHTGSEVYIKLSESSYFNLNRHDAPCLADPPSDYSYTEVSSLINVLKGSVKNNSTGAAAVAQSVEASSHSQRKRRSWV